MRENLFVYHLNFRLSVCFIITICFYFDYFVAFRLSLRYICSEDGENRPLNEGDIEWQVKCAKKRRAVIRLGLQAALRVEMSISRPHENQKYMIPKKPFNSIFSLTELLLKQPMSLRVQMSNRIYW